MLGENDQEPEIPDIRQMADTNGDFLKSINSPFGLTSPIQPSRDEIRAAKGLDQTNAYSYNMNLSLELQKIVNEHLQMEEYPAAEEYVAGLDHEQGMDMQFDLMRAQNNDMTLMGGDENLFFG